MIRATAEQYTYTGWGGDERTAYRVNLENEPEDFYSVNALNSYREALEHYSGLEETPENIAILDYLESCARDVAEELEVLFIYNRAGKARIYTPAAHWEPSGSCSEWEESAQEGYDYGWDI